LPNGDTDNYYPERDGHIPELDNVHVRNLAGPSANLEGRQGLQPYMPLPLTTDGQPAGAPTPSLSRPASTVRLRRDGVGVEIALPVETLGATYDRIPGTFSQPRIVITMPPPRKTHLEARIERAPVESRGSFFFHFRATSAAWRCSLRTGRAYPHPESRAVLLSAIGESLVF
jgi:hypothetical protein